MHARAVAFADGGMVPPAGAAVVANSISGHRRRSRDAPWPACRRVAGAVVSASWTIRYAASVDRRRAAGPGGRPARAHGEARGCSVVDEVAEAGQPGPVPAAPSI